MQSWIEILWTFIFMSQRILTGYWTDWSYGAIRGACLTLSSESAGYLIAFVALFNGWVGTGVWKLFAFLIHEYRSTTNSRDGAFHQFQAALRNSTKSGFPLTAFRIGMAWRGRVEAPVSRAARLMLAPTAISMLFSALSILSSRLAYTGDVLMAGGGCGNEVNTDEDSLDGVQVGLAMNYQNGISMTLSNAYARACVPQYYDNMFHHIEGFENLGNVALYSYGANAYQPTRFGLTQPSTYSNVTFMYGSDNTRPRKPLTILCKCAEFCEFRRDV